MLLNFSRNARHRHSGSFNDRSRADPNALDPENPKTATVTAYVVADKTQTDVKRLKYLENKVKPALTEGLFWYQEFRAAVASPEFVLKKGDTFKIARGNFQAALQKASELDPALLQLCILSTTPVSTDVLTYAGQLLATTVGTLNNLLRTPRHAIANDISYSWHTISECALKSIIRPEQLHKVEQLSLPEFREQFLSHTAVGCKCKEFRVAPVKNHYDRRPLREYDAQFLINKSNPSAQVFVEHLSIELPSQGRDQRSPFTKALHSQCARIFNHETASFSFTWQRAAPAYSGGFDTFLWERHSNPPLCDYAEVFYQDDTLSKSKPRRVLLTVSTTPDWLAATSLLGDLKLRLRERTEVPEDLWPFMKKLSFDPQSPSFYLLPLFAIFDQIIRDTATFLEQASDEVMKISYAGRSASSIEKVQYLCHLDDCRKSAVFGLKHVNSVVDALVETISQLQLDTQDSPILKPFLSEKKKDLEYLMIQLEDSLEKRIMHGMIDIKEHRNLAQTQKTSTLTYIATVWVPFSFLTGMLSMSVTNPAYFFHPSSRNPPDTNTTSDAVAAAVVPRVASAVTLVARAAVNVTSSLTQSTPTTTDAIYALLASQLAEESVVASDTAANGSPYAELDVNSAHVWPFGLFLGLAIFLFFTSLILPLVGPNILRIIVQRSYKVRQWWIFWPILFFFYYVIVYWAIPEAVMKHMGCGYVSTAQPGGWCRAWNGPKGVYGYFYTENFAHGAENPISTITYIASAIVMGSIGLANITLAIMYRRGALITGTWLLFAAVVITVYMLDWWYPTEQYYPFPIGSGLSISAIVPLIYLAVVYTVPAVMEWWRERKAVQEEARIQAEQKAIQEEVKRIRDASQASSL